jgi:hypothetical protein
MGIRNSSKKNKYSDTTRLRVAKNTLRIIKIHRLLSLLTATNINQNDESRKQNCKYTTQYVMGW